MSDATLTVYRMPGNAAVPTLSPFCLKLETWLRMAEVPYRPVIAFFHESPNGKMPFAEHRGERITDSDRIIAHVRREWRVDLDAHLGAAERAHDVALRAMIEHGLKFAILHYKFGLPENLAGLRAFLAAFMPEPMLDGAVEGFRSRIVEQVRLQGLSDLSEPEIAALSARWIDTIADTLGDKPFLLGDRPSSADATAYGFLAKTFHDFTVGPLKPAIARRPNLLAYLERIDARWWRA